MKKKFLLSLALAFMLALGLSTAAWAEELTSAERLEMALTGKSAAVFAAGDGSYTNMAGAERYAEGTIKRQVYDTLCAKIHELAQTGGSTIIKIPISELGLKDRYLTEEYRSSGITQGFNLATELKKIFYDDTFVSSLKQDCAGDLYWCYLHPDHLAKYPAYTDWTIKDGNKNRIIGFKFEDTATPENSGYLVYSLKVKADYRDGSEYILKAPANTKVQDFYAKAEQVVAENAGKPLYNRLEAYKNAVIEWNKAWSENNWVGVNGDPDHPNSVIPELARGFQQLCNMDAGAGSEFICYLTTGETASYGTWPVNLVRIGDVCYLVDVSACAGIKFGNDRTDDGNAQPPVAVETFMEHSRGYDETYTKYMLFGNTDDEQLRRKRYRVLTNVLGYNLTIATEPYKASQGADFTFPVRNVALNQSALALTDGGSFMLTVLDPPNATDVSVVWTSSDEKVATVDQNGLVSAKLAPEMCDAQPHEATITATVSKADGTKETHTCKVTVAPVRIESITLEENEQLKKTNSTTYEIAEFKMSDPNGVSIKAIFNPTNVSDKKITWTSNSSLIGIKMAEDGASCRLYPIPQYLPGHTEKNAIIKGVVEDTGIDGKEKQITVKIANIDRNANYTPVTSVALNKTALTLQIGDGETLTATVQPDNASVKVVTWSSSNEQVATVDSSGKVTAVGKGTAVITATINDKKAECTVTVEGTDVLAELDKILNDSSNAGQVQQGVAELIKDEDYQAYMNNLTNENINSLVSDELMDKIAKLEEVLNAPDAVNSVFDAFPTEDVAAVGVKLNDDKAQLKIDKASADIVADNANTYNQKYNFSMSVVDADEKEIKLNLPVKVTLPLPDVKEYFLSNVVKIWHRHSNTTTVINVPAVYNTATKQWTVSFMVKDFSDFAMTYTSYGADEIYKLNFDTNGGHFVNADQPTEEVLIRAAGNTYTLPSVEYNNHTFKYWSVLVDGKETAQETTMNKVYALSADVTLFKAVWEENKNNNGGGSSGGGSHRNPNSGGGTTTLTKPGETTKPGTTTEKPGTTNKPSGTVTALNINNVFADVKNGEWYSEAVAYVYNKGMMNGTEKGFEPNAATTRAMLVTMLYRLEGEPTTGAANFSDVASGQWFSKAIAWASVNGVVKGYENGTFAPNAAITREQLAAVLYRYAQAKGQDVSAKGDLSAFSDSAKVSGWATEAMQWAVGAGIVNGDNNNLRPQGNATRAEVAMMIMRFLER